MLFSSVLFLYYFLPAVIVLYTIAPKKLKNAVLLISSLIFYGWGEKLLVLMLMGTVFAGWLLGLLIENYRDEKKGLAKAFFLLSVIIDLGLLGYFKYADFFISSVNRATGLSIPLLKVALPIGISFYTFQILSYTIDVYRGRVPAQRNLIDFAAYVALFPQLIAGPIVRYADIAEQLENRTHSLDKAASGVRRFIIGLGKKVLIANVIGEVCVHFRASGDVSVLYHWMYAIAFLLQIYYDFSGYSDMAIGLGRMFGFEFMENFNYPYISASVTEFWRRWHISLGSWFRDYVYIPLGGNRKGVNRQLFNILVVWMLTGLWHGAAWNFVLWGLFYAMLLMIEKAGLLKWLDKHKTAGHVYTLAMVMFGFVLFNAPGVRQCMRDIAGLFGVIIERGALKRTMGTGAVVQDIFSRMPFVSAEALYYFRSYAVIYVIGMIGATPWPRAAAAKVLNILYKGDSEKDYIQAVFSVIILVIVTAYLVDGSFNPFLYFRF